ncbi:MAG: two-component regulator propeller domain-containing protein, partial [Ignavibacteria bacterium]|nr:two-component regulator propeller domain-containing protein [Ignavibacteria bacterium]
MYLLIILFLALSSSLSYSQQVSNWQNYTDMKNVKSLVINGSLIWGASDGGAFSYNINNNSYNKYSKVDGLNGVSITAAAIDQYGKVWFGSSNGIIDVYDPQTNSFRSILDIFNNTDKNSKVINELAASGDTIFVSSDFGISLINASNYLFFDTFSKFGELPSNISVNSIINSGVIYACTDLGIAIQKAGSTNLSAPKSWNVYRTVNGLPSDSAVKIVLFNNSIIAATSKGLASFDGSSWTVFTDQFNNILVNDIIVIGDSLFIISEKQNISKYYNGILTPVYSSPEKNLFKLNYSSQGILAATSKGIYRVSDGTYFFPNGPFANLFPDIEVDNNGVLWSASGTDGPGVGYYKYNGIDWSNFNISTTPELSTNSYFNLYIDETNTTYLGSWGRGFTIIKNGSILNFNAANTGMQGEDNDPNYLVIGGFAKDSKNNIWVLNYGAIDRKNLTKSSNLEQWDSYPISAIDRYVDESFHLVVDQYDTKWFAVQREKQGLFYFNEGSNPDPSVTSDDVSGYLNESSGLNNNFVIAIAVDRRGDVWVGTSLGVNIISNVSSALSGNPQLRISSVFSLRQQT